MKKNVLFVVIALLLLGLIGVSVVAVTSKNKLNDLTIAHQDLRKQFDGQLVEIERLRLENQDLRGKLAEKDAKIDKLKKEIQGLILKNQVSVRQIVRLTRHISMMDSEIEKYKKRIAELEAEVAALKEENKDLTDKNKILSEEKEDLVVKVTKASVVKAVDFRPTFYKKSLFGSNKVTRKASRVEEVSVIFFLQKNFLSEDGTRVVYVSIKQPNGKILVDKELSSASETVTAEDGQQVKIDYTSKITLSYVKDVDNKVSFTFSPDVDLKPGNYETIVYDSFGTVISEKSGFSFQLLDKEGIK